MNLFGPEVWRIALYTVLVGFGFYIGLAALLFFFQSNFIYFPSRQLISFPDDAGLPYEEVTLQTVDGMKLSGWFVPAREPRGVVLFCHGNGGNISHRLESLRIFFHLGLSTLIFDYRGYGHSEGKATEQGTYEDAEAAWRYLVENRQVHPRNIILFGRSLGGAVASWLASKHEPRALIIESTFTSVPDLAAELYPYFPVRLLSRFNYNTIAYLRQLKCPVLIIHSPDDDIVPYSHGVKLYKSAKEPKEFLEITGSHNDGFLISGSRYENGLSTFLTKHQ
ncbi:MAG: alpha/beta hydrolase [Ignavibacteria bacterium]|nr:alpha/beta hydrolase [Ignavibacteria bacterium]